MKSFIAVVIALLCYWYFLLQEMSGKRILVTGGAGYIGSHCVLSLLEKGYDVVVIDNLSNAWKASGQRKPESLSRVEQITGKGIIFYDIDLLDKDALESIFQKHEFECVIHFAALKAVSESCEFPLLYYTNNVKGSIELFQAMDRHNVTKLIFSSSSTVYGTPQYLPITEEHPTGFNCANPYGKSKYFVEEILKDTSMSDKRWQVISLRYFNPVGAHKSGRIGEDPTGIPNNLVPFVSQVAIGKRKLLKVYGHDYDTIDGTGVRDYIHILDLIDGHINALEKLLNDTNSEIDFKAYNLGTGTGYSVLQVIKAFEKACNCKIPFERVGRRHGDVASSYCDASLAYEQLGWKSKYNLQDMCEDMWRWQTQNPNGYRKND